MKGCFHFNNCWFLHVWLFQLQSTIAVREKLVYRGSLFELKVLVLPFSNYLEIHLDWLEILHSWLIGFVKTFMLSLTIRLRSLSVPATLEVLIQFNVLKIPLSAEWLDFFSLSQAYYIITTQFLYQIVWYDHFEFQTLLFWFGGYWCKNTPRYAIYDIDR